MQMKVNENQNQVIKVSASAKMRAEERTGGKKEKENRKTIYAGDIGMQNDFISMKKQSARKRAMKIINDAWNTDRKIDQGIEEIKGKIELLRGEFAQNQDKIAEGNAKKEQLREEYGVEKDSQEQKDLELLEKQADSRIYGNGPEGVQFTEEEEKRLAELEGKPLTEYQKRAMKIHGGQEEYKRNALKIENQIEGANASIRDIKLERLKTVPPMVKAKKKADKILEQASEEVIGLLAEEAKEHIDETYEEIREEAKEKAEEKEKQEERLEAVREEKKQLEQQADISQEKNHEAEATRKEQQSKSREETELLENVEAAGRGGKDSVSDAQAEIKEMLRKIKLLEEDLKGISVDEEL